MMYTAYNVLPSIIDRRLSVYQPKPVRTKLSQKSLTARTTSLHFGMNAWGLFKRLFPLMLPLFLFACGDGNQGKVPYDHKYPMEEKYKYMSPDEIWEKGAVIIVEYGTGYVLVTRDGKIMGGSKDMDTLPSHFGPISPYQKQVKDFYEGYPEVIVASLPNLDLGYDGEMAVRAKLREFREGK